MGNKIAVFCCENSSFKAAALVADPAILEAVEIIKLPCSGKAEIGLVLKTLEKGYVGVLILGCPIDNCKFIRGNARARKRIDSAKAILADAGIDDRRVHMDFVSSVDTHRFVEIVEEMIDRLASPAGEERSTL